MHWLLVFVVLFPGKQVEMVVTHNGEPKKYGTLAACNSDLAAFSMIGMNRPWAVTCVQEHQA